VKKIDFFPYLVPAYLQVVPPNSEALLGNVLLVPGKS
jgi:hypothetical protein